MDDKSWLDHLCLSGFFVFCFPILTSWWTGRPDGTSFGGFHDNEPLKFRCSDTVPPSEEEKIIWKTKVLQLSGESAVSSRIQNAPPYPVLPPAVPALQAAGAGGGPGRGRNRAGPLSCWAPRRPRRPGWVGVIYGAFDPDQDKRSPCCRGAADVNNTAVFLRSAMNCGFRKLYAFTTVTQMHRQKVERRWAPNVKSRRVVLLWSDGSLCPLKIKRRFRGGGSGYSVGERSQPHPHETPGEAVCVPLRRWPKQEPALIVSWSAFSQTCLSKKNQK